MVPGTIGGIPVLSPVICNIIHLCRILILGRGRWWHKLAASAFCCSLAASPSGPDTNIGAYMGVLSY